MNLSIKAILPSAVTTQPSYMNHMFHLLGRRCLEHGFTHALDSVAKHTLKLRDATSRQSEDQVPLTNLDGENSYFEFKLLMFGWLVGGATFFGELILASQWSSARFTAKLWWWRQR